VSRKLSGGSTACRRRYRPAFDFVYDGLSQDAEFALKSLRDATHDNINEGHVQPVVGEGDRGGQPSGGRSRYFSSSEDDFSDRDNDEDKGEVEDLSRGGRRRDGVSGRAMQARKGGEQVSDGEDVEGEDSKGSAASRGRRRRPRPKAL
jgi:hypothetical protein